MLFWATLDNTQIQKQTSKRTSCTEVAPSDTNQHRGAQLLSSESLVQKVHQFITVYG